MVDVASGFAAITHTINLVRDLSRLRKDLSDAEFQQKIADLSLSVADLKLVITDLKIENDDLRSKLDEKDRTRTVGNYQVEVDAEGNQIGNPFCNACLSDGRRVKLEFFPGDGDYREHFMCSKCSRVFQGREILALAQRY